MVIESINPGDECGVKQDFQEMIDVHLNIVRHTWVTGLCY